MSASWCALCNTQHAPSDACPGELEVTEPERHGWRVLVHTGSRTEVYGVLIGPTGGAWRARVLTFPRMLWSIPGGRGTIKFAGRTPQEAERKAVEFILAFCKGRGYSVLGEPAVVESAQLRNEASGHPAKLQARQRFLKSLPIRYGRQSPQADGQTGDLSHGGLFVMTARPLPTDSPIKLRIDLDGFSVPLSGRVAWSRSAAETGRPAGMGVQLTQAPPIYRRYVDRLRQRQEESAADGGDESPA
ncbi:MAG TPA: PilZ domain-containing protein [Candidatus Polarisedimenticolaceae bacterium]|nr:PilZ domain-containing protein [Candidatus Polarisedimenticolaceae bacterium]